jgi:hypothetical protein
MNLALADVVIVTAVAVSAGIAFTVWRFNARAARDRATTELLKRFFDGKQCAICKRPIPPVHRTGLKPGLLNPATHQTYSWDEIPSVDLSTALETHLPLCSECEVAESFRQHFPDLVTDRDKSRQSAPPPDRIEASS